MHFIHRCLHVMYVSLYLPCFLLPAIDTFHKIVQVKNLNSFHELSLLELCCAQAIPLCKAVFIGDEMSNSLCGWGRVSYLSFWESNYFTGHTSITIPFPRVIPHFKKLT